MSQQITVILSNNVTALVDYYFATPFVISNEFHSNEYTLSALGETTLFNSKDDILKWLDKSLNSIAIPARILKVTFLKENYNRKALIVSGNDLRLIESELDKIPRFKYQTAEAPLYACLPDLGF